MSSNAFKAISALKKPMEENQNYIDVSIESSMVLGTAIKDDRSSVSKDDTVTLHFNQIVDYKPKIKNLLYAIGTKSELGIHITGGCFELDTFPSCPKSSAIEIEDESGKNDFDMSSQVNE